MNPAVVGYIVEYETPADVVSAPAAFESGIHRYEFVQSTASWNAARVDAIYRGGHLACFETEEEYQYVISLLEKQSELRYLRIGARRALDSEDYYWRNLANQPYGSKLNGAGAWCSSVWRSGEPSLTWSGNTEAYGCLQYNETNRIWTFNDIANNLYSGLNTATVGYIVEYEEPPEEEKEEADPFEPGIHTYAFIQGTCSWNAARQDAIDRGGHLVCFETEEEYLYVLSLLEKEPDLCYLRIGARRDPDSEDYHWRDLNDRPYGPKLNSEDAWCSDTWHPGEPNLVWRGSEEAYCTLQYDWTTLVWGFNDIGNEVSSSLTPKTVGYIVEFEDGTQPDN